MFPSNWKKKTQVMGVINVTPDSFSDGGECLQSSNVLEKAIEFVNHGVDLIDIGAQSTRPGAIEIDNDEELKRLIPCLKIIRNHNINKIISVDTFSSKVAYEALIHGANWINDISGGRIDKDILKVASEFSCPIVLTHSRGTSLNMDDLTFYKDFINDVISELNELTTQALKFGINQNNIIWDPGLGFAKNNNQNLLLLKNINKIKNQGFPLLIGASRKRFIGSLLDESTPKERDFGTLGISSLCSYEQIDIVRVHNVKANVDLLKITDYFWR
tara:strand:+ start:715 stop:1533 length:819 start_codon:yes stop_codon:yes gene_type:complete